MTLSVESIETRSAVQRCASCGSGARKVSYVDSFNVPISDFTSTLKDYLRRWGDASVESAPHPVGHGGGAFKIVGPHACNCGQALS